MTESIVYVGVDTSKKQLDAFITGRVRSFENTLKGTNRLVACLEKQTGPYHLVFEATGGYERLAVWDLQSGACGRGRS